MASLVAQLVKNPPAMRETWVRSLGWEDSPGGRERLPTPVFWPGEFHGLYSPWGRKESDTTEQLSLSLHVPMWASQVALVVKNLPANAGDPRDWEFDPWVRKSPWRKAWQPTLVFLPRESRGQRRLEGYHL